MSYKKIAVTSAAVLLALSLVGCGENQIPTTESQIDSSIKASVVFDDAQMFTDRDKSNAYDTAAATTIEWKDDMLYSSSQSVALKDSTAIISHEGTYILQGNAADGQLIIDAPDTAKIQIVLNGLTLYNTNSAPIYVKSSDKVFITLADNSENTLSTTEEFVADTDANVDGVIFSKADVTLNGNGSLTVNSAQGHGIVSKDDLVITGGNYAVTAGAHALSGKDSIRIAGGTLALQADKDGLHAENTDNVDKGFIYITGGELRITAEGDGVDASNAIAIAGGELSIIAGGGAGNAEKKSNQFGFGGLREQQQTTQTDATSCKGIKSDSNLTITNGNILIDSADDALHCAGDLTVSGGTCQISTGDDGLHADATVFISDGTLTVTESYEGIEGTTIDISGGSVTVAAEDDGINAAGGNDQSGYGGMMGRENFGAGSECCIIISGGSLNINANGDGIDSNGDLTVTGGTCYVAGPTNSGNGALDYDGNATISGGIFVATGAGGMAQNFGTSSAQGAMLVSTGNTGGTLKVTDANNNVLVEYSPEKAYQCAVISTPEIKTGESYTVTTESGSQTVTMSSIIYNNGAAGGMSGGFGGEMPQRGGNKSSNGDIPRGEKPLNGN